MARKRRPYTAASYLRIFTYLTAGDQVIVLCAYQRMIEVAKRRRGRIPGWLLPVITFIFERAGLTGIIMAKLLEILVNVTERDLLDCERQHRP